MCTVPRDDVARRVEEYKKIVPLDDYERAVLATFTPEEQLGTLKIMHHFDQCMSRHKRTVH